MTRGLRRYLERADDIGHESDERQAMLAEIAADRKREAEADGKCAHCGFPMYADETECPKCSAAVEEV